MSRSTVFLVMLTLSAAPPIAAQRMSDAGWQEAPRRDDALPAMQATSLGQAAVHYGKWLTALGAAAFTVMAAQEHNRSEREWDALVTICRSEEDACVTGPDGRYLRSDAELLYQRSRYYDKRANRRLLGAQASLVVTAALFILDLRPGDGPENIPFSPVRVTLEPTGDGAEVGMRVAF